MKFFTRLSTTALISGLIILLVLAAIPVARSYAEAQSTCLTFPQKYSFMVTRFNAGSCQFRENDGWVTFNPAS